MAAGPEPNNLVVSVQQARELTVKGHAKLDAFAVVTLSGHGAWKSKAQTELIKTETHDAVWNEELEFQVDDPGSKLTVTVFHKTRLGGHDTIGSVEFQLEELQGRAASTWYDLHKKAGEEKIRGRIALKFALSYKPPAHSVSSLTLNKQHKVASKRRLCGHERRLSLDSSVSGNVLEESKLSKLKHKIGIGKNGRRLSDATSMVSNFSQRSDAASELNRTFANESASGIPSQNSTLNRSNTTRQSIRGRPSEHEESFTAQPSSASFLRPPLGANGEFKRHSDIIPHSVLPPPTSPSLSTASSFLASTALSFVPPRPPSAASSGYGPDDLEREVRELRRELANKEAQLMDMKEYMERVVSRALDMCPQILEISPSKKTNGRSARFVY